MELRPGVSRPIDSPAQIRCACECSHNRWIALACLAAPASLQPCLATRLFRARLRGAGRQVLRGRCAGCCSVTRCNRCLFRARNTCNACNSRSPHVCACEGERGRAQAHLRAGSGPLQVLQVLQMINLYIYQWFTRNALRNASRSRRRRVLRLAPARSAPQRRRRLNILGYSRACGSRGLAGQRQPEMGCLV